MFFKWNRKKYIHYGNDFWATKNLWTTYIYIIYTIQIGDENIWEQKKNYANCCSTLRLKVNDHLCDQPSAETPQLSTCWLVNISIASLGFVVWLFFKIHLNKIWFWTLCRILFLGHQMKWFLLQIFFHNISFHHSIKITFRWLSVLVCVLRGRNRSRWHN